jgi:hypothetical protein
MIGTNGFCPVGLAPARPCYLAHTVDRVSLYLEESFSFRVLEPDAAIGLTR